VRAREARTVFNSYDRNRSGALEVEELQTCLEDLGIMVSGCPRDLQLWKEQVRVDRQGFISLVGLMRALRPVLASLAA
jgi:Ca2+-binding EF-hand superfamily protein